MYNFWQFSLLKKFEIFRDLKFFPQTKTEFFWVLNGPIRIKTDYEKDYVWLNFEILE